MTPCFIMDIDGTLADGKHRLHYIEATPKNWDAYFAACDADTPFPHMQRLVAALGSFADVIFVSGRREDTRDATLAWLYRHGFASGYIYPRLYMRPVGDHRNDDILKIELLAQVRADGFEPIMAFDDRDRVVKAWRAAGIPCAQVAEGAF